LFKHLDILVILLFGQPYTYKLGAFKNYSI